MKNGSMTQAPNIFLRRFTPKHLITALASPWCCMKKGPGKVIVARGSGGFSFMKAGQKQARGEESRVHKDIVSFMPTDSGPIALASLCFMYMMQFKGVQEFSFVQTEDDLVSQTDHRGHKSQFHLPACDLENSPSCFAQSIAFKRKIK